MRYYRRQLCTYNLAIVIHSKSQTIKDVFFYTWPEGEAGREPNEIISALSEFLKRTRKRVKRQGYRKLFLFCDCDSCGEQNKNVHMLSFLLQYVNSEHNLFREVRVIFPISGHSYMALEFGRIEKDIRKQKVIIQYADVLDE